MNRTLLGAQLVRVPSDLGPVTDIDHASEAGDGGLSSGAVEAIWQATEKLYRTGAYPGISLCLRRRGEVVLNRSLGHAAGNGPKDSAKVPKRVLQTDAPICLFSASKAITAILVHKLAEEGGVDLDAPVSHYLPAFAANGKSTTTVSRVLAHQGGFPMFNLPDEERSPERLLDWHACIETICAAPPEKSRKRRLAYHAITGGFILGEIIQRVTGGSLSDYLDAKIRKPMGMRHFTFGLDETDRNHAALNYAAGQPVRFPISGFLERALSAPFDEVISVSNSDIFFDAVIPAGNLYATAEELSRFYQMLLDDGMWQGKRLLDSDTVARATRPANPLSFDHTLKLPMRYSEGFMLGANPFGMYGPMTAECYGHLGFMNILGWADPRREIAASLLVTGKAVLGGHLLALGELLSSIAWQCR
jgi:CubicO group peptidase (beta-lactamase class C family)